MQTLLYDEQQESLQFGTAYYKRTGRHMLFLLVPYSIVTVMFLFTVCAVGILLLFPLAALLYGTVDNLDNRSFLRVYNDGIILPHRPYRFRQRKPPLFVPFAMVSSMVLQFPSLLSQGRPIIVLNMKDGETCSIPNLFMPIAYGEEIPFMDAALNRSGNTVSRSAGSNHSKLTKLFRIVNQQCEEQGIDCTVK